jgi:hypothetical protein
MKLLILALIVIFTNIAGADQKQADKWYAEVNGDGTCSDYDNYSAGKYVSCFLAERRANNFGRSFDTPLKMAHITDKAIQGIMKIAAWNLGARGFEEEAIQLEQEMVYHEGEIERIISRKGYDIGDFKPLSSWLAGAYSKIEHLLGYEVCYALRLSDIKTINYALPICFNPCPTGLGEFTAHFCGDAHVHPSKPNHYRGLAPVVSYWVTDITCSISTFGAGWAFVCGPLSMVVERFVDWKIAPALAPRIFERVCK